MIKAKRSLGQNFFVNQHLKEKIVSTIIESNPTQIVEIGPGTGSFTSELIKKTTQLILIEKDDELAKYLTAAYPGATLHHIDVLRFDFNRLKAEYPSTGKKICFGSLPYNISKQIIRRVISSKVFNECYFIIQQEVAQKYLVRDRESNFLALSTQIYGEIKLVLNISPDSFKPRPKVNSSLVRFTPKLQISSHEELEKLTLFLKQCFKQPRKTLANNLKQSRIASERVDPAVLNSRPSELDLQQYIQLFHTLNLI